MQLPKIVKAGGSVNITVPSATLSLSPNVIQLSERRIARLRLYADFLGAHEIADEVEALAEVDDPDEVAWLSTEIGRRLDGIYAKRLAAEERTAFCGQPMLTPPLLQQRSKDQKPGSIFGLPLLDEWKKLLAAVTAAEARLKIFRDAAHSIAGHIGNGIAKPDAVDAMLAMAAVYDFFGVGDVEIELIIGEELSSDREIDWEELDRKRERERGAKHDGGSGEVPRSDERPPPPLPYVDLSLELVPREWLVPERIPMRNVSLISGEGSIGKSLLLMQLSGSVAVGLSWIGTRPQTGPVLYVSCEEDDDEMRRRAEDVANSLGVARRYMVERGLRILSFAGRDAILAIPDRNGIIRPTPLFERIRADALQLRPKLIVLDTAADTFGGKEIDRAQTRQFITLMRGVAIECDSAVVMSAHPSLTGISTDTGLSGNTAWHNSVRARIYLKRAPGDDTTLRALEIKKNNYGPVSETVLLRWRDGVYVAEGIGAPEKQAERVLERLAAEQKVNDLFLTLLRRLAEQGRNVSDKVSSSYAPSVFASEPEAKAAKASKKTLTEAMARLFAARKIRVVSFGSPSKMRSKIVEAGAGEGTETATILPFPTPSNDLPTPKSDLPTTSQRPSDAASNGLPTPSKGCAPTPPLYPPSPLEGARGALEGPAPPNGGQKGETRGREDGLPPDAAIIGPAAPGERCISCGKAGGEGVYLIRRPGVAADQLHVACAARAWTARPMVDLEHLLEEDTGAGEDTPGEETKQ